MRLVCFLEDLMQEQMIFAVARRVAEEVGLHERDIEIDSRNAAGGYPRAKREFERFLEELQARDTALPDVIIVAVDADDVGPDSRREELKELLRSKHPGCCLAFAIPDPYVERWYLLDPAAVKQAVGVGPAGTSGRAGDRNSYKALLSETLERAGVRPSLGGYEYAQAIIDETDLYAAGREDPQFGRFVEDLKACFRRLVG